MLPGNGSGEVIQWKGKEGKIEVRSLRVRSANWRQATMWNAKQVYTGFVETNGTQLYYEMAGASPPLVRFIAGVPRQRGVVDPYYPRAPHSHVRRDALS